MGDAELLEPARERQDDVARRAAVIGVALVEVELALVKLQKALMPPGFTTFTRAPARCMVQAM